MTLPVLWHSNAPWTPSGYGKQTQLFVPRIGAMPDRAIAISAFFGLQGSSLTMGDIRVYPKGIDMYGNDVLELHAKAFFGGEQRAGLTIVHTDVWVMQPDVLKRLNSSCWVPVDHSPCQPPTVTALRDGNCIPISMSRFGDDMLRAEGFEPVYVPHGVETNVFQPYDQAQSREALDIPKGAFLVGMVAANQGHRKSWPQAVRAFGIFRERHPEAMLFVHSWLGDHHQGFDLHKLIEQHVADPNSVLVCDQYKYAQGGYPDEFLARLYSSMDVLLNPAQGEGFGVCLIEAQACGTPVIVTNFSSMPELCGSGWLVGGSPIYTSFQSWQLLPDIEQILEALESEYARSAQERLEARKKARAFALQYDADLVTERFWAPALEELEARAELKPKPKPKKSRRPGTAGRRKR